MENHGFNKTTCDHCVFVKKFGDNDFIILLLYMDGMLIVGQDANNIYNLKRELSKSFAMKNLGPAKQILSMKISRDRKVGKLWLSSEAYVERVLERFNMGKAKSVCSPLAGHFKLTSEHYPYIARAVGVVNRFLSNPGNKYFTRGAVSWQFRL